MRISDWSSDVCSSDLKQKSESLSIDRTKTSISISEKLDSLIPAGKIAALKTGELAGMLAVDTVGEYTGKYARSAVHCRVNLNVEAIQKEETGYVALQSYYEFKGRKEEDFRTAFAR